jgi:2-keto-3-deoxy-L-rhamnonate aldolase RhmA
MVRKNRLRELLRTGQPSLGTRLHIAWPTVIELVGHSGMFDYVEILAEYAPYGLFELENQGRAIDLFDDFCGLIKIGQDAWDHLAVKAQNSGIQNLLFADIRTAADAERCVRAVRAETPGLRGLRGVGQGRDVGVVLEVGSPAFVQSTRDAVVALMIEKKEAIENLEAILAVPGIDMVQFGPADYAMSIGAAGRWDDPRVQEAERHLIETALKRGVHPRAEIQHPSQARHYLDLGVKHFCVGTDMVTLWHYFKETGVAMRGLIGGESGASSAGDGPHAGYRM